MKVLHFITGFILLLFISGNIAGSAVFTTGLSIEKNGTNIMIEWKANTNQGQFSIYRNSLTPIESPNVLIFSSLLTNLELEGKPEGDLYKFPVFIDPISYTGKFFYLVVFNKENYDPQDFLTNSNFNVTPVSIFIMQPEKEEGIGAGQVVTAKDIYIKTNDNVFYIFWDVAQNSSVSDYKYTIYKTTKKIEKESDLINMKPAFEVDNDNYIEDNQIQCGTPYYYTIIANGFLKILPGTNQNLDAVFLGSTNVQVRIEKEVYERVKINSQDLKNKFKK